MLTTATVVPLAAVAVVLATYPEPASLEPMPPRISIIIPTLNEAKVIEQTLQQLQSIRQAGHEVILSDGGSSDNTTELAEPLTDMILSAPTGRAAQMNFGTTHASGDVFWFLHADTIISNGADQQILLALESGQNWGRFNVRLSGQAFMFRVIEYMMNLRSCLSGIATGDQGIFVQRKLFADVNGFEDIPLMEDISLSRKLKRSGRPVCIKSRIITSSRRWEENGIFNTILLMWHLRLAYFFGVSPHLLANRYQS